MLGALVGVLTDVAILFLKFIFSPFCLHSCFKDIETYAYIPNTEYMTVSLPPVNTVMKPSCIPCLVCSDKTLRAWDTVPGLPTYRANSCIAGLTSRVFLVSD